MNKRIVIVILMMALVSCEKWDESSDISRVSYLPQFELSGGEFISMEQNDGEFFEPGVKAFVDGKEVNVFLRIGGQNLDITTNTVDLSTPGVYIRTYYAENRDGVSNTAERLVAVTHEDVTDNDLSGNYIGTLWDPVSMEVKKSADKGLYEAEEVMGFPGFEMPGRFVDIGRNELVLLPDEGYFGRYGASEGTYTNRTLSWTIFLIDDPYEGIQLPVTWVKTE
jgi:hypothetical protein